jgi:hypothetical protein
MEQKRAAFLAYWETALPAMKAEIDRDVMLLLSGFSDRFTVFPDSGEIELHCYKCQVGSREARWKVGYHPSLDVLIEQARAHNRAEHPGD